jgi:hypothetical protein
MAVMARWLHFGYADMMDMEVSIFREFIVQIERMSKEE